MRIGTITVLTLSLAIGLGNAWEVRADSGDYRFEAVEQTVPASPAAVVKVRIVRISTGKAVPNAMVLQSRMEMLMTGMAPMPTKIAAGMPDGNGVYPFTADLSMAGPWALTFSAKVQGETANITGSVPFSSAPGHEHMDGMNQHH